MSLTTQIFENEYAQENEVLALLEESQFHINGAVLLERQVLLHTVLQVQKHLLLIKNTLTRYGLIHL